MAAARQRKSKSQNAQPAADPQQAGSGLNEVAATRALSSRASYESSRHETAKDSLPSAAAGSCAAGSGPTADQKVVYITKPTPRKRHWGLRFLALALAFYFGLLAAQRWDLVAKSPLDGAVVSLQSNASEMLQQILDDFDVSWEGFVSQMPSIAHLLERDQAKAGESAATDPGAMGVPANLSAKHPVIIVPGMTNTPLTLFKGRKCAQRWLRLRLWGSIATTARLYASNSSCFLEHLEMDSETGLDPPDVKLRSNSDVSDIESVFGIDMWRMMVDRLVGMGYDSNNIVAMPYDWRLATDDLERRDRYLTRLRRSIEFQKSFHEQKVAIMCHSYGGLVVHHFLDWVEKEAGPGWVEEHVAVLLNIASPALGVPKALSALLSGETKDSTGMGDLGVRMGDVLIPRKQRIKMFRSYGCLINMLPKGGQAIWGSLNSKTDGDARDTYCQNTLQSRDAAPINHGAIITLKRVNGTTEHLDMPAAAQLLLETVSEPVRERIRRQGAVFADVDGFKGISEGLRDPLSTPLPNAPSLQVICAYGVAVPTERRYHYREVTKDEDPDAFGTDITVDTGVQMAENCVNKGVHDSDGDGSVPLVSLGLLCRKWAEGKSFLNPSGLQVTTVEIPSSEAPRPRFPLPNSAAHDAQDHLGIMGNAILLSTALRAAAGDAEELQDVIHSSIDGIAQGIAIDPRGAHSVQVTPTTNHEEALHRSEVAPDLPGGSNAETAAVAEVASAATSHTGASNTKTEL